MKNMKDFYEEYWRYRKKIGHFFDVRKISKQFKELYEKVTR